MRNLPGSTAVIAQQAPRTTPPALDAIHRNRYRGMYCSLIKGSFLPMKYLQQ
jgi:hypothetical protein